MPTNGECWIWQRATDRDGYGQLRREGSLIAAHRFLYEVFNGPIPEGKNVLHHCDTPPCVNPDHLFLGTQQDNLADMCAKGRQAKGATHGSAQLTENDVLAIRADDRLQKEIAVDYGISQSHVSNICSGRFWPHVE